MVRKKRRASADGEGGCFVLGSFRFVSLSFCLLMGSMAWTFPGWAGRDRVGFMDGGMEGWAVTPQCGVEYSGVRKGITIVQTCRVPHARMEIIAPYAHPGCRAVDEHTTTCLLGARSRTSRAKHRVLVHDAQEDDGD